MFGLAAAVYVIVAGFILYASTRGRRRGAEPSTLPTTRSSGSVGCSRPIVDPRRARRRHGQHHRARCASPHATSCASTSPASSGGGGCTTRRGDRERERDLPPGRPADRRSGSPPTTSIHSFWVPQLAGKEDAIPGQVNQLRFTADDVGTYLGQCAEYCGIQHAHMSIRVHVARRRATSGAGSRASNGHPVSRLPSRSRAVRSCSSAKRAPDATP